MTAPHPALTIREAVALRAYGRSGVMTREDVTRCAVEVSKDWHVWQCAKPRGHGPDGLLCKGHARKDARGVRMPDRGTWGEYLLARLQKERGPLVEAVAKLEQVDQRIRQTEAGLALLRRGIE